MNLRPRNVVKAILSVISSDSSFSQNMEPPRLELTVYRGSAQVNCQAPEQ